MLSRFLPHLKLLHKVVWGGSVAGLALVAEERRHQISFAQRVLENGKLLQAHKSYKTSAPLSNFEIGGSRNADVIDVQKNRDEYLTSYTDYRMTMDDWKLRKRKRRTSPSVEITVGSSRAHEAERIQFKNTLESPQNGAWSPSVSAYELHLHELVAKRAQDCISDDSAEMKALGHEEISAFLSQAPRNLSSPMRKILASYGSSDYNASTSAGVEKSRVNVDSLCQTVQDKQQRGEVSKNEHPNETPVISTTSPVLSQEICMAQTQLDIAHLMRASLAQNRIHDAFIQFLRLCESVTEPLLNQTKQTIAELVDLCKQSGAFSLVEDIEFKALSLLGYWQLIVNDMTWLLSREISPKRFDLCCRICSLFLERGAQVEAIEVWKTTIGFFLDNLDISLASDLFFRYENLINISCKHIISDTVPQRLLRQSALAGAVVPCLDLTRYLVKKEKLSADLLQRICEDLLLKGHGRCALDVYATTLRGARSPMAFYRVENFSVMFTAALELRALPDCIFLAEWLNSNQLSIPENLLQRALHAVQHWLELKGGDHTQRSFIVGNVHPCGNHSYGDNLQRLLSILFHMAIAEKLPILSLGFFEVKMFRGAVDCQEFQLLLAELYGTGVDDVINLGGRCQNLQDVTLPALEVILLSSIARRDVELADRILNSCMSLLNFSDQCLNTLAKSAVLFRNETLLSELITTILNRKLLGSIAHLGEEIILRHRDDLAVTVLLYQSLVQYAELTSIPGMLSKMQPLIQSQHNVHTMHQLLLRRCWDSTRNWRLFDKIRQSIRSFDPTTYPSKQVYLETLRVFLDRGMHTDATTLLQEMVEKAQIPTTGESVFAVMLPAAKKGNWETVKRTLIEAKPVLGAIPPRDWRHFNGIFAEYCKQHSSKEALEFLLFLDSHFHLYITPKMRHTLIDGVVTEQDLSLAVRLSEFLFRRGIKMKVTRRSLGLMMKRLNAPRHLQALPWISFENPKHVEPQILSSMLHETVRHEGEKSSWTTSAFNKFEESRQSSVTKPSKALIDMPENVLGRRTSDSSSRTTRLMLTSIRARRYGEAIDIYKTSVRKAFTLRPLHFILAVHAAILRDNNALGGAHEIMQEAQKLGINPRTADTPLLLREFRARRWNEEDAKSQIFEYYRNLESQGLRLNHHITIAAAQNLLHFSRDPEAALRLIQEVSESQWARKAPLDLPTLTLALRLFFESCNVEGIKWVLNFVRTRGLQVDRCFSQTLRKGRKRLIRFSRNQIRTSASSHFSRKMELVKHIRGLSHWKRRLGAMRAEQRDRALDFATAFSGLVHHDWYTQPIRDA